MHPAPGERGEGGQRAHTDAAFTSDADLRDADPDEPAPDAPSLNRSEPRTLNPKHYGETS